MENENINNLFDRFFGGNVPRTLEIPFVCFSLGAPIQYFNDPITAQISGCMMVPNKQGGKTGYQPYIVTFGKEDSVGTILYQGVYHQLDVDFLLDTKLSDDEVVSKLAGKFQKMFNLGNGNSYPDVFKSRTNEFLEKVAKPIYPEYYGALSSVVEKYLKNLSAMYSTTRTNTNAAATENKVAEEEKKTTNGMTAAPVSAEAH